MSDLHLWRILGSLDHPLIHYAAVWFLLHFPVTNKSSQDLVEWPSLCSFLNYHLINTNCFPLNQLGFKWMKQFLFTLNIAPSDPAPALLCQGQACLQVWLKCSQIQKHPGPSSVVNHKTPLSITALICMLWYNTVSITAAFSFHSLFLLKFKNSCTQVTMSKSNDKPVCDNLIVQTFC